MTELKALYIAFDILLSDMDTTQEQEEAFYYLIDRYIKRNFISKGRQLQTLRSNGIRANNPMSILRDYYEEVEESKEEIK
jgi:hypothetical protein